MLSAAIADSTWLPVNPGGASMTRTAPGDGRRIRNSRGTSRLARPHDLDRRDPGELHEAAVCQRRKSGAR